MIFKSTVLSFAVLTALASTCNKKESEKVETKDCLQKLKAQLIGQPPQNPPGAIWQYNYQGVIVYLVPAPCCDKFNPLYNLDCEVICYPEGGITGKGDGKCNDFHNGASDKKLVWKDTRSIK